MAESARVIRHQRLAHQRAQEITRNHRTTPLRQPSIKLDTIITTPTHAHASDYRAHHSKHQDRVFTPINFNVRNSSHLNILLTTNYMIPPAPTYPALYPLHPNSPTLGTNLEIHIHSPTESSPMHSYPPGLHSEPSRSTIASEMTVTSKVALLLSRFSFDWLRAVKCLSEKDSDGTH